MLRFFRRSPNLPFDTVCEIWSSLHPELEVVIGRADRHYLTTVALHLDDDLTAALLLRKVRRARVVADGEVPDDAVRMNSLVDYGYDGRDWRSRRLVHDAPPCARRIGIASSEGAALIGLRAGRTVLWPTREGTLKELEVRRVESGAQFRRVVPDPC